MDAVRTELVSRKHPVAAPAPAFYPNTPPTSQAVRGGPFPLPVEGKSNFDPPPDVISFRQRSAIGSLLDKFAKSERAPEVPKG